MKKEKIIVYGTGGTAKFYVENDLDEVQFELIAFCDSNPEKWNTYFLQKLVISPTDLKNINYDSIIIGSVFYDQISEQLIFKYKISATKIHNIYYKQLEKIQKRYINFYQTKGLKQKNSFHRTIQPEDKIAIYTAITGNYDTLRDPIFIDNRCQYICYTDNLNFSSNVWEPRLIPSISSDNNRNAKQIKILPHEFLAEFAWSIWVDAALQIKGDLLSLLNSYAMNSHCLSFMHYCRSKIYEEAEIMKKVGFDQAYIIEKQINRYKASGYCDNNELIAGGVLFRKHNEPEIIELMKSWWYEISHGSKRDQLSFNYCAWKKNTCFDLIDMNIYDNPYFKVYPHNRKKNLL